MATVDDLSMGHWYGYEGAASALADALEELKRLEDESKRYHYEMPPQLRDDMRSAARRVRNAVRYLMTADADE